MQAGAAKAAKDVATLVSVARSELGALLAHAGLNPATGTALVAIAMRAANTKDNAMVACREMALLRVKLSPPPRARGIELINHPGDDVSRGEDDGAAAAREREVHTSYSPRA